MSDQLKIFCKNIDRYIDFKGGETLLDVAARIELPFTPICARVNNKTENLHYQLFAPKQVEFLSIHHPSGERAYTRTLCMVLYRALEYLYENVRLRISHSISGGYYCRIYGDGVVVDEATADKIRNEMRRIISADMPIQYKERLKADAVKIFRKQGLDSKVKLLNTIHELYCVYYKLDGICDSYYGTLAPSTGIIKVFDFTTYKEGFLLRGFDKKNRDVPAQYVTQEKMFKAFTDYVEFNNIVGVRNVGELNEAVLKGKSATLINVAEALHDKYISRISDEITRRYNEGGARVVLIAGPSSSGKTTTTKRLGIQLMTNLLRPQMISLDDYFVDRHHTPRDEAGDFDYESIYALDLEQFNRDLLDIIDGKEVALPTYNFQTGLREYKGNTIKLTEGSILLIEGIHGLNPELTKDIPDKMKFRLYVSALTTLSIDDHNWIPTTDNRLLRRIIRDYKYRGASAEETLKRWPSVRRGEEKWIFPYQENADATFNSSLIFELAVMRPYGEQILSQEPHDVPQYGEAYRLRKFLSYFLSIDKHTLPSTSLLREFLGGSSFKY